MSQFDHIATQAVRRVVPGLRTPTLEQMQSIRDRALSEMARVSSKYVICTEPFAEFNQAPIQQHYMTARGYMNLSTRELPSFGLDPFLTFGDWPQKLSSGAGLVAARAVS